MRTKTGHRSPARPHWWLMALSDSNPTIEDVARAAGVSVATVSRALRGLDNVATSTREKVAVAAEELGWMLYFMVTFASATPGMLLLVILARREQESR